MLGGGAPVRLGHMCWEIGAPVRQGRSGDADQARLVRPPCAVHLSGEAGRPPCAGGGQARPAGHHVLGGGGVRWSGEAGQAIMYIVIILVIVYIY